MDGETLKNHADAHGLDYKKYDKGHKGDTEGLRAWAEGLYEPPVETTEVPEPSAGVVQNTVAKAPAAPTESKYPGLDALPELLHGGKLCMSGKAEDIIPRLMTLIGSNSAWLSVHLSFTSNRKDD